MYNVKGGMLGAGCLERCVYHESFTQVRKTHPYLWEPPTVLHNSLQDDRNTRNSVFACLDFSVSTLCKFT